VAALLIFIFSLSSVTAQTIYVKKSNGTQTAHALSNLRKITFSSGNVTVQKTDNTTDAYALSGLEYLSFNDFMTGLEKQIQASITNLITYPNPVDDVLNIDLSGSENMDGIISILSLEGKVVQKQKINDAGIVRLNLSQLPLGIYLCRYTNHIEIKTVKIIKQ
jgi:hypothetical protein